VVALREGYQAAGTSDHRFYTLAKRFTVFRRQVPWLRRCYIIPKVSWLAGPQNTHRVCVWHAACDKSLTRTQTGQRRVSKSDADPRRSSDHRQRLDTPPTSSLGQTTPPSFPQCVERESRGSTRAQRWQRWCRGSVLSENPGGRARGMPVHAPWIPRVFERDHYRWMAS